MSRRRGNDDAPWPGGLAGEICRCGAPLIYGSLDEEEPPGVCPSCARSSMRRVALSAAIRISVTAFALETGESAVEAAGDLRALADELDRAARGEDR